jgi:hypothetical protein
LNSLLSGIILLPLLFQANIIAPTEPPKPKPDCRSAVSVLPDGTRQFKDCSGATTSVKREPVRRAQQAAAPTSTVALEPATATRYQESLRAQYEYQIYSYNHAERTFDWQYWSGKIIFWGVLLLVATGVFFSAAQFYLGLRQLASRTPETTDETKEPRADLATSEFEATLHGIKLKSSVLGLLILAMSMVFFYLYLSYVYPVKNVSP